MTLFIKNGLVQNPQNYDTRNLNKDLTWNLTSLLLLVACQL